MDSDGDSERDCSEDRGNSSAAKLKKLPEQLCNCPLHCYARIGPERVKYMFEEFHSFPHWVQNEYIQRHIKIKSIAKRLWEDEIVNKKLQRRVTCKYLVPLNGTLRESYEYAAGVTYDTKFPEVEIPPKSIPSAMKLPSSPLLSQPTFSTAAIQTDDANNDAEDSGKGESEPCEDVASPGSSCGSKIDADCPPKTTILHEDYNNEPFIQPSVIQRCQSVIVNKEQPSFVNGTGDENSIRAKSVIVSKRDLERGNEGGISSNSFDPSMCLKMDVDGEKIPDETLENFSTLKSIHVDENRISGISVDINEKRNSIHMDETIRKYVRMDVTDKSICTDESIANSTSLMDTMDKSFSTTDHSVNADTSNDKSIRMDETDNSINENGNSAPVKNIIRFAEVCQKAFLTLHALSEKRIRWQREKLILRSRHELQKRIKKQEEYERTLSISHYLGAGCQPLFSLLEATQASDLSKKLFDAIESDVTLVNNFFRNQLWKPEHLKGDIQMKNFDMDAVEGGGDYKM